MTFVVKVPGINAMGKTNGCEKAGNCILNSLKEIYSNENGVLIDTNLLDLEEIHLDNSNLEEANELIYQNSLETFETKKKSIFLGGDHSISYSICRAFFDYCNQLRKDSCIIVFDAHADCCNPGKAGKEPTHEEWLRKLIEIGFSPENVLLVGTRNISKEELIFLNEHKIKIIKMNQFLQDLEDTCDIIMEFAQGKEIYLSIDIDVLEPVFAPGTGYKEPGGLTTRELIYLLQRINKIKSLRAIDIVEINPDLDKSHGNITLKTGAKILSEFI